MNDYEKLKKTFEEIGVTFKEKTPVLEDGAKSEVSGYDGEVEYDQHLKVYNGVGYYRFWCDFYFLDGKYQNNGVWE